MSKAAQSILASVLSDVGLLVFAAVLNVVPPEIDAEEMWFVAKEELDSLHEDQYKENSDRLVLRSTLSFQAA